jgi:hypothetical protein
MNGNESQSNDIHQFLTPKQQKLKQKHRDTLRLVVTIITTNLFVALAVASFYQETPAIQEEQPQILENHLLMHLPLQNLVPLDEGPRKVSLFDSKGKLVIYGATLTHALSQANSFDHEGLYALQIPSDQVQALISHQKETLTAHPYLSNHQSDYAHTPRRSYEILF